MKNLILILSLLFAAQYHLSAQVILELSPSQSMSVTGKGSGQDAAINPYSGSNSLALIENVGENEFTIRVQNKKGKIIESVMIQPNKTKDIRLLLGYELFLDCELEAKAKVNFEKLPEY